MNPAQQMAAILLVVAGIGVAAAALYAVLPVSRGGRITGRTALARAGSYAALALALALAVVAGTLGVTILLGVVAALALLEWARLGGLPPRHVIAIEVANAVVFAAIATRGTAAADILVGGLVPLVGWAGLAGLAVIVALGAVWGDLLESAAKREFGVKDAGTWLPGFGGILDRVDSLLLALPLVYWAARLLDPVAVP